VAGDLVALWQQVSQGSFQPWLETADHLLRASIPSNTEPNYLS
jgi:hypothetical protein